jgi:hypothetical protein
MRAFTAYNCAHCNNEKLTETRDYNVRIRNNRGGKVYCSMTCAQAWRQAHAKQTEKTHFGLVKPACNTMLSPYGKQWFTEDWAKVNCKRCLMKKTKVEKNNNFSPEKGR